MIVILLGGLCWAQNEPTTKDKVENMEEQIDTQIEEVDKLIEALALLHPEPPPQVVVSAPIPVPVVPPPVPLLLPLEDSDTGLPPEAPEEPQPPSPPPAVVKDPPAF